LTLAMLFIVSLFLIGFGNWLYAITHFWYLHPTPTMQTLTFFYKPYGILGFVLVGCGALVLAVAIGLLFDWYHLLIHRRT
jgi:ABC-type multidrug transport system permease subunit